MHHQAQTVLRFSDLKNLLKVSRSTVDRWERAGTFPKRLILGENSIGWRASDITDWLTSRVKKESKK